MLAQLQRLLEAARVKRIPIVFTATEYERDLQGCRVPGG
jgi:hypothetical protein